MAHSIDFDYEYDNGDYQYHYGLSMVWTISITVQCDSVCMDYELFCACTGWDGRLTLTVTQ